MNPEADLDRGRILGISLLAKLLVTGLVLTGPDSGTIEATLTSYGDNFVLPLALVTLLRRFGLTRGLSSLIGMALPSIFEYAQKMDLYPGTYDTNDFWVTGMGVIGATLLDAIIEGRHRDDHSPRSSSE